MASDHDVLTNAIGVVETLLLANRPDLIVPRLRQGHTAAQVAAELAADARAPVHTAVRAPAAAAAPITDTLAQAIEARFRSQNPR